MERPPTSGQLRRALDGYPVEDGLLHQALSHRSYCSESGGLPSNERLELLGDAVLGLVVTDHLYRAFPSLPEGDLARLRASVVSTQALAPVASDLGVGEAVLLGKGEETSGGRSKESILADCLEAIIGAVYLSGGLEAATRFVVDRLAAPIAGLAAEGRLGDPKNQLQELAAQLGLSLPLYKVRDRGPDHAKVFSAEVSVGGKVLGHGTGPSKKHAERVAAAAALDLLVSRPADAPAQDVPLP
jgi:ribonuclease III